MAAGIGLGISMGWTYIKKALGLTVDGIFAILQGRSQFFENETSSKAQAQVLDTAGVLGKANVLITPTSYSVGKLNAVLPSNSPFGDFAKAGGSNATRINSSGNVQDIISSYPRIDYEDASTGVLCEYQTTNFLESSEEVYSSPWTSTGMGGSTVTMTLPDGSTGTIQNLYVYASSGTIRQTVSAIINKGAAASVWAYNPDTTAHNITIGVTGHAGSGATSSLPPGVWTRIKFVTPAAATSSYTGLYIHLAPGKSTRLWGAQLEPSQFQGRKGVMTSYIPTAGTAVTRVAELLIGPVTTGQINSEEGVFLFEGKMTNSGSNEFIYILGTGGATTTSLSMYGNSTGNISGRMTVGGINQYFPVGGSNLKTSYNKLAIKWDGTTLKTFANGSMVTSRAQTNSFSAGDLNQISLSEGQRFFGKMKMLALFNEALTDAEVIAITT